MKKIIVAVILLVTLCFNMLAMTSCVQAKNTTDFVIPEDVAAVFGDVCCHRLVLATKARMMEEKPENLIRSILESVKMPVLKK